MRFPATSIQLDRLVNSVKLQLKQTTALDGFYPNLWCEFLSRAIHVREGTEWRLQNEYIDSLVQLRLESKSFARYVFEIWELSDHALYYTSDRSNYEPNLFDEYNTLLPPSNAEMYEPICEMVRSNLYFQDSEWYLEEETRLGKRIKKHRFNLNSDLPKHPKGILRESACKKNDDQ